MLHTRATVPRTAAAPHAMRRRFACALRAYGAGQEGKSGIGPSSNPTKWDNQSMVIMDYQTSIWNVLLLIL